MLHIGFLSHKVTKNFVIRRQEIQIDRISNFKLLARCFKFGIADKFLEVPYMIQRFSSNLIYLKIDILVGKEESGNQTICILTFTGPRPVTSESYFSVTRLKRLHAALAPSCESRNFGWKWKSNQWRSTAPGWEQVFLICSAKPQIF